MGVTVISLALDGRFRSPLATLPRQRPLPFVCWGWSVTATNVQPHFLYKQRNFHLLLCSFFLERFPPPTTAMSTIKRKITRKTSAITTKVGSSVVNTTQIPFKFTFTLFIDTIENIVIEKSKPSEEFFVVFERREKLLSTHPKTYFAGQRKIVVNDQIDFEATLFKPRPDKNSGDPSEKTELKELDTLSNSLPFSKKMAKFAVRRKKQDGKTVAKCHLDLADYVQVPDGTLAVRWELSEGALLVGSLKTQLVKAGRSVKFGLGTSSRGSSIFSKMTTGSGGLGTSSRADDDDYLDDDDLDDLDEDDFGRDKDDAVREANMGAIRIRRSGNLEDTLADLEKENSRLKSRVQKSEQEIEKLNAHKKKAIDESKQREQEMIKEKFGNNPSRFLRERLRELEQENEELERLQAELFEELDRIQASKKTAEKKKADNLSKKEQVRKLQSDIEGLEAEVEELKYKLSQPPPCMDVVEELKIAKMALALASMEKDEVQLELNRAERGFRR